MQARTSRPLSCSFHAMGTDLTLSVWPKAGCDRAASAALKREAAFLRRAEQRLSRLLPDSELSRLNRTSGTPVPLSRLTFDAIAAALTAAEATGGLFDPTIHEALVAAGYDRSFQTLLPMHATDSAPIDPRAPAACGRFREIVLDERARAVTLSGGVKLDLGGIAKGWLADLVARRLRRFGAALTDLGGDIAVAGLPLGEKAWRIGLSSDDRPPTLLGRIEFAAGGVATSGVTRRRWRTSGGVQHHLIDPRTGLPALTDLLSATIVAPSAMVAEAAAKAVLLLGAEAGVQALERTPGLGGVLLLRSGGILTAGAVAWLPFPLGAGIGGHAS